MEGNFLVFVYITTIWTEGPTTSLVLQVPQPLW